MRVLVIEDDEIKRNQVVEFLRETFSTVELGTTRSLQSGLRSILTGGLDLIILDMSLPTFDIGADESGGRPHAFGGREILRQMGRRGIQVPVIVLTQFDKFGVGADGMTLDALMAELERDHAGTYVGTVYYNVSREGWKEALMELMIRLGYGVRA
jgi:CheY-like chemotaxis protein